MPNVPERACEEIDAAVFSGDFLFAYVQKECFRAYVQRWLRALEEQDRLEEEMRAEAVAAVRAEAEATFER